MEVVASLSQGRTAAAQCGLFTYKSVPVIFEPPCTSQDRRNNQPLFFYTALAALPWQTQHSTRRRLFTRKLDLNLRKGLVKCYNWSTALYVAETWTLRKVGQKILTYGATDGRRTSVGPIV